MATSGTTDEGLDLHADRVYISGAALTLVAYTNTADSIDNTSTYSTLTQPTSTNGYAPLLLVGVWSSTAGIITFLPTTPLVAANASLVGWSSTGVWSTTVTGVALVDGTATLIHFKDLAVAFTAADGKKLGVDLDTVIL